LFVPDAEHNQRLLQAIRVGNIGIFEHDHATDSIFWSLELRQMYGWDAEEPATLPKILSHVHPEDLPRVGAAVRQAHDPAGDGAFDIEHRIVDRRGAVRWVLTRSQTQFEGAGSSRRATQTIGAVQDVTERRSAEERLRILDTVLRSSGQAVAIADARGQLTFVNAALCRLYGYPDADALLGKFITDLWPSSDGTTATLERLKTGGFQHVEVLATRLDGSRFFLGLTAEAVSNSQGELTQVLLTFTDITERKRLEAELLHAQKLESIGRLAGGVAHDFNNILTVISGGIELSLSTLGAGHPCLSYLSDAAQAARSAAALTRQLLAFSRKGPIAPRALDVNEVIRRMQRMIGRLLGEEIQLTVRLGQELPPISFDPWQVEQILLNLVVNARDAMPRGGQLSIETTNRYVPESVPHGGAPELRKHVVLSVSDSGAGMTEEVRSHLFEPFYTTKEPGKGTGLGLAMVYGAVRQNGGRIEVESELGRGTTFTIYLPASATPLSSEPDHAPIAAPKARRASIILVEDDSRVATFAKAVLDREGHTTHVFGDAETALSAMGSLSPTPELLVTDVVLPGLNGRVLAEHALKRLPKLRVLFVSGYAHDVVLQHGVLLDESELLTKPYSAEQLALRVQQLLPERAG
jgi:PAS domain S-box-containing protein